MRTAYLVENIRFSTDLAENRVLFTSATSFTPKSEHFFLLSRPLKRHVNLGRIFSSTCIQRRTRRVLVRATVVFMYPDHHGLAQIDKLVMFESNLVENTRHRFERMCDLML